MEGITMTANESKAPETVNELYFYMQGEFKELRKEIQGERKFTGFISGFVGLIAGGVGASIILIIINQVFK